MNFNQSLQRLYEKLGSENKHLIVFKGFSRSFLKQVPYEKLLKISLNCSIQQLDNSKKDALLEAISKGAGTSNTLVWCTFEELIMLDWSIINLYFEIKVVKNNLYHLTFPSVYDIENINSMYTFLSEDEPEEDDNGNEQVSLIQKYYGNYKVIDGGPYVTYSDDFGHLNEIEFYQSAQLNPIRSQSTYEEAEIELSDDETSFISFLGKVISHSFPPGIIKVAFSGDLECYTNNYLDRLRTLQKNYEDNYQIELISKTIEEKQDLNESEYLSILKKYWKFEQFRNLRIYENIHEIRHNKNTIEVSQGQIIDDIVQQAGRALSGESYRDVFVTSPTGAGKSLMFQIPAIYLADKYQAVTIVITPLIGLMTDQVEGLQQKNINMSATINSSISPIERMQTAESIKNGEINILYISPETLLSRSDITMLIGERPIGLFVIDEAHIVTTWGKAFRSDYWYLGNYLNKLRKEKKFPVATFTATAIYGGIEDMYTETRDSLGLNIPISYFGYIKRDNIEIRIKKKKKDEERKYNEYLAEKKKIMLIRLEKFVHEESKTLVYFPGIRLINDFYAYCEIYGSLKLRESLTKYYGPLNKEEKNENYLSFKRSESCIMLATKAFGMGIDIPDIENVYHFAPTGNVCDYVQEIGRVARNLEFGYAYFDFLPKDFVHVQRLHGISTIRKNQLVQVISKILNILEKQKEGNIRNILVSADEFRYIFQTGSENEEENFDHKVKTALLIIEKDFNLKVQYSPIVARPRSVFAKEYFIITRETWTTIPAKYSIYFNNVRKLSENRKNGDVYALNMKQMWIDHYSSISFPNFKRLFFNKEYSKDMPFSQYFISVMKLDLDIKETDASRMLSSLSLWTDAIAEWFSDYAMNQTYFSVNDLAKKIKNKFKGSLYSNENLAEIIMNSAYSYDRLMRKKNNFYTQFLKRNSEQKDKEYYFTSTGYSSFIDWIQSETLQLLRHKNLIKKTESQYEVFLPKSIDTEQEKVFLHLGLLESLGLVLYQINGGDNPEIFIRINSKAHLERIVANPSMYNNRILENVYNRHRLSVSMLNFLFEREVNSEEFWDLIEDYFLGKIPDEVLSSTFRV